MLSCQNSQLKIIFSLLPPARSLHSHMMNKALQKQALRNAFISITFGRPHYLKRSRYQSHRHFSTNSSGLRSTTRCNVSQPNARELRELYTIKNEAELLRARITAEASVLNLSEYLSRKPLAMHTKEAFKRIISWRSRNNARNHLCLDSGCGCGQSTRFLARKYNECDVIGVDKSAARLERNEVFRKYDGFTKDLQNGLLIRGDLIDFWTLCFDHQVFPKYHHILYPNPYPKWKQLKNRWHGHAIFPVVVALGGLIEIRSSWDGYLHEFRTAFDATHTLMNRKLKLGLRPPILGEVELLTDITDNTNHECITSQPISNFEAKYVKVGQPIYRLIIDSKAMRVTRKDLDELGNE